MSNEKKNASEAGKPRPHFSWLQSGLGLDEHDYQGKEHQ
jgi:hypothetical protein